MDTPTMVELKVASRAAYVEASICASAEDLAGARVVHADKEVV